MSDDARRRFNLSDDVDGVVVTDVNEDSPAGEKGLRAGDVIVEVSQEPVSSPSDVAQLVANAKDAGRKSVLLLLQRGDDLRFVALRIDEKG
jgi:serine protease Do